MLAYLKFCRVSRGESYQEFRFPSPILAKFPVRFAVGFRRDFGRRDYYFPARILVRFAAGSRRDFGCQDFCFSARIVARFTAGSRRDFGCREFHFSARFPPGKKIPAAKISPGSQRVSRRDRGGIPPRSRSLFYKGIRDFDCESPGITIFK